MADEIINRVAKSNLVSIDLETFYTTEKRSLIDIKYWLFQELVLKEKEFRETLKKFDWQQYKNHHIALHCSSDAIVPTWAYMLIQTHLNGIAKTVIVGSMGQLESIIYAAIINNLNLDYCTDKPVIIKGCANKPVPKNAYLMLIKKLQPIAKSIMYGEACSSVPLTKRKKI